MFSENYSVCLNDDGSPREISHNGPVVTYKAMGYDTGRAVAMQLIPVTSLSEGERVRFEESAELARKFDHPNVARVFDLVAKDDHLVFVSEYLDGESAEDWIDEHGPMPADVVLRIGFQVANAMAAAEELGLTPRSIQPANLIILPGVAADGGWPGIKIRNFGLPAVKLNCENGEARELLPSMPPQFASPEKRANTTLDVRSDIFSLGATMWFLLTGNAPPSAEANALGPRLSAPDVPRFVRNLVSSMLRTNPEERPQDPGDLAATLRVALQKAERKTAFTRSFAPAALPGTMKPERKPLTPALALAAAVVVLAVLGAFVLPQRFASQERKPVGVLIGVPETTPEASAVSDPLATPAMVPQQTEQSSAIAQQSVSPPAPSTGPMEGVSSANADVDKTSASAQLADNNRAAEPPTPAEGPIQSNQLSTIEEGSPRAGKTEPPPSDVPDSAQTAPTESSSAAAETAQSRSSEKSKTRVDSRPSKRTSRHQRVAKSSVPHPRAPLRVGSEPARVVATTAKGNWVLRLPSGEKVIAPPVPDLEDAPIVTPRHIRRVDRPIPAEDEAPIVVVPPDY